MVEVSRAKLPQEIEWFDNHVGAARQVLEFLAGDGVEMVGTRVADIGCGDGIIDLGLAIEGKPSHLDGYDIALEVDDLLDRAVAAGYADQLPGNLHFKTSAAATVPAPTGSYDVVVSWSAFEHILEPLPILRETRRILADDGVFFVQLWPFWSSQHGSHLWDWYPEGWAHMTHSKDELHRTVHGVDAGSRRTPQYYWDVYRTLNKVTLDQLGQHIYDAGFRVVRAQLDHETVHLPRSLVHLPLSELAVSGVKLLARPRLG